MNASEVPVLWRDGEPWRDLTAEVMAVGTATIISESGTARFIDVHRRLHVRQPIEGGKLLIGDQRWLPFSLLVVTPCGVVLEHPSFWSRGTRLRVVFAGLVDGWMTTAAGVEAVRAAVARVGPTSPGHPVEPCAASYCTARLS